MDVFDEAARSRIMRAVKGKNTSPEKAVRSLLHTMGYRYRLHCSWLPGSPDIVFPGRKAVIFVHGCFWHRHDCLRGRREPKEHAEYWQRKREANVKRDQKTLSELETLGWRSVIVWECEIPNKEELAAKLAAFLGPVRKRQQ